MVTFETSLRYQDWVESPVFQVTAAGAFALATSLAAQIEIPTYPVPFTLQTLFVLLAGGMLKPRAAFLSLLLYLSAGTLGLPVFSGGSFGVGKLLGPTGGYLLAFPLAAFSVAYVTKNRKSFLWMVFSMTVGSLIFFLCGTIQLNLVLFHNWSQSIKAGFLVFSFWDAVKIVAAASIASQYHKVLH